MEEIIKTKDVVKLYVMGVEELYALKGITINALYDQVMHLAEILGKELKC